MYVYVAHYLVTKNGSTVPTQKLISVMGSKKTMECLLIFVARFMGKLVLKVTGNEHIHKYDTNYKPQFDNVRYLKHQIIKSCGIIIISMAFFT